MQPFVAAQDGQLFCSPEHRIAWNNRATVRGRVITPLAIVARVTRNGTRNAAPFSDQGSRDLDKLIRRYVAEDRDAGRMPWPQYLARRYAAGFDPV